jgi:hypothetical protein
MTIPEKVIPRGKKINLIALIILSPIVFTVLAALLGALIGARSFQQFKDGWQSIGTPPGQAEQLLGLCERGICVRSRDGKQYTPSYCAQPGGKKTKCWVLTSAEVEPIIPELVNPCQYHIRIPGPPTDTIQMLGSMYCGSEGDTYRFYALLEDGSVWELDQIFDYLAPLNMFASAAEAIPPGFITGVVVAILLYIFGFWVPARKPAIKLQQKDILIMVCFLLINYVCMVSGWLRMDGRVPFGEDILQLMLLRSLIQSFILILSALIVFQYIYTGRLAKRLKVWAIPVLIAVIIAILVMMPYENDLRIIPYFGDDSSTWWGYPYAWVKCDGQEFCTIANWKVVWSFLALNYWIGINLAIVILGVIENSITGVRKLLGLRPKNSATHVAGQDSVEDERL